MALNLTCPHPFPITLYITVYVFSEESSYFKFEIRAILSLFYFMRLKAHYL
jgi:hypothetical protein